MLVGATAAGGGLMLAVGRAVVAACGSGVLTPACTGLMTELGVGVAEAASGVPTLGVGVPVAAAVTTKLKQIAETTTDAATVAKELQAIVGEAKASESARLLNNFYRDGAPPDLIQKTVNAAAKNSTHNPLAPEVVLGRFVSGSADSYDEVAKARGSTYFSMSDWTAVHGQLGEEKMWSINQAFLDQQIAQGKQFLFTQDPRLANPKSYTFREYEHLINNGFDIIKKGNSYVASPSKL
jgi:filamentous hemagglutinin